ncbi:MAG TPA: ribosome silencing factor [Stellaceae bacterium]|nr:ribosome silencing factor [Stellaceae bacterium]
MPSARKIPAAKRAKPSPLLATLQTALEDGKAEDITRIDLRGKSSIADDLLIASGRSARQVAALAERVTAALAERGQKRVPVEGMATGDWVLIDAGDVIVHIFRPEVRARYNLEKMWGAEFDGSE